MKSTVSVVNHAELVNDYYMGLFHLREDSMQIPKSAFIRPSDTQMSLPPAELSATAARRKRKRETASRRRLERLEELTLQRKFVPLSDCVRQALRSAFELFGGSCFVLRDFLPLFEDDDRVSKVLAPLPSISVQDVSYVHCNETGQVAIASVDGTADRFVVLPPGACFAQQDVRQLGLLGLGRHKLIVMDPPWHNKSVSRGKRYQTFDHTQLLEIDVPHIADLDDCILAVWVTNKPTYMTFLLEQALPAWGFTFHACWYWLKLAKSGDLVTPLDSTHRLPVETMVVAYRGKDPEHEQRLRHRLGEQMRIVLSIPLRHSWKPPPECFFDEDVVSPTDKKIELFARELRPHWTSVGNEVLKFQASSMFQEYS
ncbi:Methyltransferase-like protein 4 [Phytophthora boehmeriae]|uniref:Methyltransferase-like protein 4 n=1 Tax=Phytophthora boehmeriae TaxID=109152 RepID=A0A8T1X1L0_9STRA|nr:Methyltransferase-like protein 4 [Phytophthora boehmeriae]